MPQPWRIVYYESIDGQCPMREFIDARSEREQAKLLSWIEMLADRGPDLPRPYSDFLEDGIHEYSEDSGNADRLFESAR